MKFGTCLFLEIEMALQAREVDKSWFHLSLLSCCCCWFKNLKVLAQSQKFSQQLLNEKSPLLLSSSKLIPLQTLIKTSLYCLLLCIYFCLLKKIISLLLQLTGCPTSILPFSKAYFTKTKAVRSKIPTVLGVS